MTLSSVEKKTVQNSVFQLLKDGILSLTLVPGTTMSTQEMATKLQVSRTPVRESFIRLQEEGLVDIIPQRETVVSRISWERVKQERFIRKSLELAVIDPLMENCTPEDIENLQKNLAQQKESWKNDEFVKFIQLDDQMHQQFFQIAHQSLAWDTIQMISGHDHRYRILAIQQEDIRNDVVAQHAELINKIASGNREAVRKEASSHLDKVNVEIKTLLQKYPNYFVTGEKTALSLQILL